jgi:hypothetical protein
VATVGGGPEALGSIEGVADATTSLVQLASGYLADRTGKLKALTFAGYGLANSLRPLLGPTRTQAKDDKRNFTSATNWHSDGPLPALKFAGVSARVPQ